MGQKGEKTKQQIRAAALVFFELGYTRVSMQDICMKSGLSKSGLYRHYEDKSQPFMGLLQLKKKQQNVSYLSTLRQYRF